MRVCFVLERAFRLKSEGFRYTTHRSTPRTFVDHSGHSGTEQYLYGRAFADRSTAGIDDCHQRSILLTAAAGSRLEPFLSPSLNLDSFSRHEIKKIVLSRRTTNLRVKRRLWKVMPSCGGERTTPWRVAEGFVVGPPRWSC